MPDFVFFRFHDHSIPLGCVEVPAERLILRESDCHRVKKRQLIKPVRRFMFWCVGDCEKLGSCREQDVFMKHTGWGLVNKQHDIRQSFFLPRDGPNDVIAPTIEPGLWSRLEIISNTIDYFPQDRVLRPRIYFTGWILIAMCACEDLLFRCAFPYGTNRAEVTELAALWLAPPTACRIFMLRTFYPTFETTISHPVEVLIVKRSDCGWLARGDRWGRRGIFSEHRFLFLFGVTTSSSQDARRQRHFKKVSSVNFTST